MSLGARSAAALLLLALSALPGCGPGPVQWAAADRETPDFEATRTAFTRSAQAYEGADGRLFARATWFSPRFAAALAHWQAQRAERSDEARATAVNEAVTKAKAETWVFLALTTGDYEWNDLGEPNSTLRVRLQVDDRWLDPVAIDRLSVDQMADRRVVFPYAGDLTVGYDIVFPQIAEPGRVRLEVVGIPGRAELSWTVRKEGSPR